MDTDKTALETYFLEIPKADISLLKPLVKRLGWIVHKTAPRRTAYEQALDD